MNKKNSIYTVGHGNTGFEDQNLNQFIALLNHFKIKALVDVRSQPISSFASWFNKEYLKKELEKNHIEYRFAGDYLGGRPKEKEFYDDEGAGWVGGAIGPIYDLWFVDSLILEDMIFIDNQDSDVSIGSSENTNYLEIKNSTFIKNEGKIFDHGPPEQLFGNPQNERTKQFLHAVLDAN